MLIRQNWGLFIKLSRIYRCIAMATYLIGDVQGCDQALGLLLERIGFSPSRDHIYLLGDLVNRGPNSLAVLRRCMRWADCIHPVLGNHDLHLLASAYGVRKGKRDTLKAVLSAPERTQLLDWLAQQPLVRHLRSSKQQDLLLLHAGVLPQWSLQNTLRYAQEVQNWLCSPADLPHFLRHMYGNTPNYWQEDWQGFERLRVIVNALTRLRFCSPTGVMDFDSAEHSDAAPAGLLPWFDCPQRQTQNCVIAFGHWSTLGLLERPHLIGLDTGCVWGGALSAMRIDMQDFSQRQLYQIPCPQAQKPGA